MLSEHGKYNKGRPYRTSAGIPFILRYPEKVAPGKIVGSAFTSVDFAPSVLDLMGVEDHGVQFDGESFANEVTNDYLITNYPRKKFMFDPAADAFWAGVMIGDIRLVVSRADIPWLFDLRTDPFEVINFFDDPQYETIQKSLMDDLYVALDEYDIPLKDATDKFILWSKPACYDKGDRIEVDTQFYTCEDIGS